MQAAEEAEAARQEAEAKAAEDEARRLEEEARKAELARVSGACHTCTAWSTGTQAAAAQAAAPTKSTPLIRFSPSLVLTETRHTGGSH